MLRKLTLFLSQLLVALLAGRAFWISLLDNPARFPASTYVAYFQIVDRAIAVPIAAMGTAALVLLALAAALSFRDRPIFLLLAAATLCVLTSDIVTVHYHLPINAQIAAFNPQALPANWPALRDAWWHYHKLRLAALTLALTLLSLATTLRTPSLPSKSSS
jgi:uncharacterized membrane protein